LVDEHDSSAIILFVLFHYFIVYCFHFMYWEIYDRTYWCRHNY